MDGKTLSDARLPPGVRQYRAATRLPLTAVPASGTVAYHPKNLSIGGIFLLSPLRPAVGSVVELVLTFAEAKHRARGRVTHVQGDGFGLTFVEPTKELTDAVRRVLDEHVAPLEIDAYKSLKQTMYKALEGSLRVAWSLDANRFDATLFDLSSRGLFLQTDIMPDAGATIYVYLPLVEKGAKRVTTDNLCGAPAKVVFRNSSIVGAEFQRPSAEFRNAVTALLAK